MDANEVMNMPLERMIDTNHDTPITVPATSTAQEVAKAVSDSPTGAVLVTGQDSKVDGVVTKTDVVNALAASDPATPPTAGAIATERPIMFQPSTPLDEVVSRLGTNNLVIVVDDKQQ